MQLTPPGLREKDLDSQRLVKAGSADGSPSHRGMHLSPKNTSKTWERVKITILHLSLSLCPLITSFNWPNSAGSQMGRVPGYGLVF